MIRSPIAKLVASGPLIFGCALAFALDADRSDSAQHQLHPIEPASSTELAASEPALAADPAPAATGPATGLGQLLMQDARYVLRSPARWEQGTWQDIGLIGLAVVGTAAVLDRPLQNAVQRNRNRTSDTVARVFEPFGAEYSLAVLGGFYLAGAINDDPKATAVAQDGLAASLVASGLIAPVLKLAVGRSRPAQDEGTHRFRPFGGNGSFPSGHVTQAFAVASVIAAHYEPLWIKTTAYGVASLVGYSRIYHNAHFASDVLAGAAIGSLVGTSLVAFNEKLRGSHVSLMPLAVYKGAGFALAKTF
ncbi:MAG: phosphatase PAP2 family protein [Pseudomonadota bacterium]|nr:phosphatase PAP2 family protein [Pseudomonadota bacterium]